MNINRTIENFNIIGEIINYNNVFIVNKNDSNKLYIMKFFAIDNDEDMELYNSEVYLTRLASQNEIGANFETNFIHNIEGNLKGVLITELLPQTLTQYLTQNNNSNLNIQIFELVLSALKIGIYYRDLHTGNIMYDGTNLKLIDLGAPTTFGQIITDNQKLLQKAYELYKGIRPEPRSNFPKINFMYGIKEHLLTIYSFTPGLSAMEKLRIEAQERQKIIAEATLERMRREKEARQARGREKESRETEDMRRADEESSNS